MECTLGAANANGQSVASMVEEWSKEVKQSRVSSMAASYAGMSKDDAAKRNVSNLNTIFSSGMSIQTGPTNPTTKLKFKAVINAYSTALMGFLTGSGYGDMTTFATAHPKEAAKVTTMSRKLMAHARGMLTPVDTASWTAGTYEAAAEKGWDVEQTAQAIAKGWKPGMANVPGGSVGGNKALPIIAIGIGAVAAFFAFKG